MSYKLKGEMRQYQKLEFAELIQTMRLTDKCDVYSFGVVVLEIFMGKHPGELLTTMSSNKYLTSMEEPQMLLKDVLDQRLPPPTGQLAAAVVFTMTIDMACTCDAFCGTTIVGYYAGLSLRAIWDDNYKQAYRFPEIVPCRTAGSVAMWHNL